MRKKILIVNNGFANKHITPLISEFYKLNKKYFSIKIIHNYAKRDKLNLIQRIFIKLRLPLDLENFNKRILKSSKNFNPDIYFIIKGNNVYPSTLKSVKKNNPSSILISWTQDNMMKKHNSSYYFNESIPFYDLHCTTKSNIIEQFYKKGAKKILFLNKAFSETVHFPDFDSNYSFKVLFIGTYEKERSVSLDFLAKNGIEVTVFGNGWEKQNHNYNLKINKFSLEGSEYRKALSSSYISLCFLRKINDDLQTSRSIEIPACGGFMIAERTTEHKLLFKENEEAVFFSNNDELLKKVKYFLNHKLERDRIAKHGRERVLKSNYSYSKMLGKILDDFI